MNRAFSLPEGIIPFRPPEGTLFRSDPFEAEQRSAEVGKQEIITR